MELGLRERKKLKTREAILDAAMKLFTERGFDSVTVAEVARAADVSEKTVFNYFPTKEDLVVHRGMERMGDLLEELRKLPPRTSILEPFRRMSDDFLTAVETEPVEVIVAVPRLVRGSATLRQRLISGWEHEAAALTPVLAVALGLEGDDLLAAVLARTLSWTHRVIFRTAIARLLDGDDPGVIASELRDEATRAYDMLASGVG